MVKWQWWPGALFKILFQVLSFIGWFIAVKYKLGTGKDCPRVFSGKTMKNGNHHRTVVHLLQCWDYQMLILFTLAVVFVHHCLEVARFTLNDFMRLLGVESHIYIKHFQLAILKKWNVFCFLFFTQSTPGKNEQLKTLVAHIYLLHKHINITLHTDIGH